MNVTTAQARSLWCPFARVLIDDKATAQTAANRGLQRQSDEIQSLCVGHECMAWRWIGDENMTSCLTRCKNEALEKLGRKEKLTVEDFNVPQGEGWKPDGKPYQPREDEGWSWKQNWKRDASFAHAERKGFCGLAGSPVSPF